MSSKLVGSGEYRYSVDTDWAKLPDGWSFGNVTAVATNSRREVFVFTRTEHPIIVFDHDGNFLRSWGEGQFKNPHGLEIAADDSVWCTDDGDHTVRKFDPYGKLLLTIGVPGRPSPLMSGRPFNRCTHTAHSPEGDIYVSDGYGNAAVHKYSPDGKLLFSWGEPGIGPGQFNVPHNICCDADGWVYVADRENHRVQVFNGKGGFETHWHSLHRPCALCMAMGRTPTFYVGEIGPELAINRDIPNLGPRISILDSTGKILERVCNNPRGVNSDQFIAPHGLAVNDEGDLFVAELSILAWPRFFEGPPPASLTTLRKLTRVREPTSSRARTAAPA